MNSRGRGIRITCSPLPRRIEFSADNEKNDGVRFRSPVSRTKRTSFFMPNTASGYLRDDSACFSSAERSVRFLLNRNRTGVKRF